MWLPVAERIDGPRASIVVYTNSQATRFAPADLLPDVDDCCRYGGAPSLEGHIFIVVSAEGWLTNVVLPEVDGDVTGCIVSRLYQEYSFSARFPLRDHAGSFPVAIAWQCRSQDARSSADATRAPKE